MSSIAAAHGIPNVPDSEIEAIHGASAVVTTTTAVAIIADAAVEDNETLYITQLALANHTASEDVEIVLKDTAGSPVTHGVFIAEANKNIVVNFNPALKITKGEGITAEGGTATTGDTFVTANGIKHKGRA